MDTSIIVVIAIIVVFVVAVPTMIRKSATELSRVEIDTVPDEAQVVTADPKSPGHDDTERARVFHSDATVEPTVPRPDVAPLTTVPTFTLSAPTPEFALIDGQADTRSTTDTDPTTAEAGPEHQRSVLPVAVGQTRSAVTDDLSTSTHRAAGSSGSAAPGSAAPGMRDNVRKLHPAVRAVFNESQQNTGGGRSTGGTNPARPAGGHLGDHSATGRVRSRSPQRGTPHDRSTGPSTTGTTTRGTQIPDPSFGADEDHSMSDKATRLRESKKSLGTMTRGFGLLLLASMLGVLVTGVLALFSVVHVALTGVFLGLAVVSLFIVRTLNLRKREIKARLRQLERPSAKRSGSRTKTEPQGPAAPKASNAPRANAAPTAGAPTAAAPTAAESKNGAQTAVAPRSEARSAATRDGARSTAAAKPAEGRSTGSTKAAQARAAMQRNVTAKHDREEANTGEIPLVRIRNEAAEGHTTRQVLLTGPIPVVEEAAPETAETDTAGTGTAGTDTAQATPTTESAPAAQASVSTASTPETSSSRDLGKAADSAVDKEPTAATADASTAETATTDENAKTAEAAEAAEAGGVDEAAEADVVSDPFMQRLQAREGWSPTPLPVPSYVDAPRVEHPVPETKAADATSYETEARSREDIAAEFAAELGYRPELSDSAREDGPLEHGRKAIRTNKAPELGAVDDVLARRRA